MLFDDIIIHEHDILMRAFDAENCNRRKLPTLWVVELMRVFAMWVRFGGSYENLSKLDL